MLPFSYCLPLLACIVITASKYPSILLLWSVVHPVQSRLSREQTYLLALSVACWAHSEDGRPVSWMWAPLWLPWTLSPLPCSVTPWGSPSCNSSFGHKVPSAQWLSLPYLLPVCPWELLPGSCLCSPCPPPGWGPFSWVSGSTAQSAHPGTTWSSTITAGHCPLLHWTVSF